LTGLLSNSPGRHDRRGGFESDVSSALELEAAESSYKWKQRWKKLRRALLLLGLAIMGSGRFRLLSKPFSSSTGRMKSQRSLLSILLVTVLSFLVTQAVFAGSATWNLNPTSGDWNTALNWTPATVPNGPADTATFDLSSITDVTVSTSTTVDGIVFNSGASAFTITPSPLDLLTFVGTGIVNNSGVPQNFVSPSTYPLGSISFHNQATAGSNTFFSNLSDLGGVGNVNFYNRSNAGTATFTNYGTDEGLGGSTFFFDHSSAGRAYSAPGSANWQHHSNRDQAEDESTQKTGRQRRHADIGATRPRNG